MSSLKVKGMETIFGYCDKSKTSMLKVDDVTNIMEEAPGKLANSILLFAKGKKYAFKKCDHFSLNTSYFGDISQISLDQYYPTHSSEIRGLCLMK